MRLITVACAICLAVVLDSASAQNLVSHLCPGIITPETDLNIQNASVKRTDLNETNGELRFGEVGKVDDNDVDLVITAVDYQISFNGNPNGKDKSDSFGQIALKTVEGIPSSGEGEFRFCFVEPDTHNPVVVESFVWYVHNDV